MSKLFMDKIKAWADKSEERMLQVVQEALQDVVEDAQTTKASGGNMRVDTGFLRASGGAALNEIPKGESVGRERSAGEEGVLPEYANIEPVTITLAKMKLGDKFYFGWTANYAQKREVFDGFMESAAQKWSQFVDAAVKRIDK